MKSSAHPRLAAVLLVLVAVAAYANSFSGPFVLDDASSIAGNPSIHRLWPLSVPLSPPHGEGRTVEGRPILNLSLAINYAIGGPAVQGYHIVNLAIHVLAALALFGCVRRTLILAKHDSPTLLGWAIATLWVVHPLQTESVTYIVQRAESLMGLFYLSTLYCFIRSAGAPGRPDPATPRARPRGRAWACASVFACLLGMGVKEVMVSAPVMVLLYDRTFVAGGFRAAWTRRRGYYLALAATWVPLAVLVAHAGNRGGRSGFGAASAGAYWLAQFPAVLRYLALAVWPQPLIFDYGTEWVRHLTDALPGAALVAAAAAATLFGLFRPSGRPGSFRWRAIGFLGFWFFAILAPTSLVPGNRQTLAEHRMYLALAPVIVLAVLAVDALARRWRTGRRALVGVLVSAGAALLALLTAHRNLDYRSMLALYADTAAKNPGNAFAQNNLGLVQFSDGRLAEAIEHYRAAIALQPDYATAHDNLGNALLHAGRDADAVGEYRVALRLEPGSAEAHDNLGIALVALGRFQEAAGQFEQALRLDPEDADIHHDLGNALAREGRLPDAIASYREALRLDPGSAEAAGDLGNALAAAGRYDEAAGSYEAALRLKPDDAQTRYNYGSLLLGMGRLAGAIAQLQAAVKIRPDYIEAHNNLGNAFSQAGRLADAASEYETALRLDPAHAAAHYNLGNTLLRLGRTSEAVVQFRETLRLRPDFAAARRVLERLGED